MTASENTGYDNTRLLGETDQGETISMERIGMESVRKPRNYRANYWSITELLPNQ